MPKTRGAAKVQGAVRAKRPASLPQPGGAGGRGGSRRTVTFLAVALGVAVVVIVVLLAQLAGVGQDPFERRVAELQAEEARRDRDQIAELTELAREARDEVVPHLDAFSTAVPPADRGEVATSDVPPDEVAAWQDGVTRGLALFEESPSGSTATNVARHSLSASLGLLASATDLYALAQDAEGDLQASLMELAGTQRDLAVQTWSVGATQLDAINIDAGLGHQHVYLEVDGIDDMMHDGFSDGDEAHD